MSKIILQVELDYIGELIHGDDQEAIDWFYNDILMKDQLSVFSQEIGDIIGELKVLSIDEPVEAEGISPVPG